MEKLERIAGLAAPLLQANVDTDQIIPVREMVRAYSEGYAASLFAGWRYIDDRDPNPAFLLNQEPWRRAVILVAGENFGCGSSRESAPKALREYGFRAVVAPSFGGIFYNNCFRNGMLPVELPADVVIRLGAAIARAGAAGQVAIDLHASTLTSPDGETVGFAVPPILRRMLLEGLDEIDLYLSMGDVIEAFRVQDRVKRPWAYRLE